MVSSQPHAHHGCNSFFRGGKMRTSPIARLFFSIALVLLPSGAVFAQVHQDWLARYDSAQHSDGASKMVLDGAGNIIVLGITENSPGDAALKTLKYDASGTLLWDRSFGSSTSYNIGGLAVDGSGNAVISASPSTSDPAINQILTVKYDAAGNQVWARSFDPVGCGGGAGAITTDAAGNVYVSGTFVDCQAPNSGTGILGSVKYSPSGNPLWTSTKRKKGEVARAARLVTDAQGNLYVTGQVEYAPAGTRDILAARYDSDGRERWS